MNPKRMQFTFYGHSRKRPRIWLSKLMEGRNYDLVISFETSQSRIYDFHQYFYNRRFDRTWVPEIAAKFYSVRFAHLYLTNKRRSANAIT
jgi:hypothetical protein